MRLRLKVPEFVVNENLHHKNLLCISLKQTCINKTLYLFERHFTVFFSVSFKTMTCFVLWLLVFIFFHQIFFSFFLKKKQLILIIFLFVNFSRLIHSPSTKKIQSKSQIQVQIVKTMLTIMTMMKMRMTKKMKMKRMKMMMKMYTIIAIWILSSYLIQKFPIPIQVQMIQRLDWKHY